MPTVYALTADAKLHWLDSSADPLSGGLLFVYTAGTTTKATTYRDSDGLVANANPIVLDSRGEPPHGIYVETGTYKLVLAPSTDTDPPASAIWTRDNITPINDVANATADEWTASNLTPTFVSATSFTLAGDQTTEFHEGRRLRITDSGGTDYGVITSSTFGSVTTVVVSLDAGSIDSGISAVDYSILSADSSAVPHARSDSGGLTLTGDLAIESGSLQLQMGSDVASAAALAVNVDGNIFDVTGSTGITSLASKGVGSLVVLKFDAAPKISHHSTNLILPGSTSIQAAAGDIAVFYEYASGDWRLISYQSIDAPARGREYGTGGAVSGTSTFVASAVIPDNAAQIILTTNAVSTDGTSPIIWQLNAETSGYVGYTLNASGAASLAWSSGIPIVDASAGARSHHSTVIMTRMTGNTWGIQVTCADDTGARAWHGNGTMAFSGTPNTAVITTAGGTDSFDAGSAYVGWA